MVEQLSLSSYPRTAVGRAAAKQLRRQGWVPAIIYGGHIAPRPVQVSATALRKALEQGAETHLINLQVEGEEGHTVLVREIQRDTLSRQPVHVDFYAVVLTEKLRTNVPLTFVGAIPRLVADNLAVINEALTEVEVECLPLDLPASIEVDISTLVDFDSVIRVRDLKVPSGVTVLANPDDTVASLSHVRAEVEAEAVVAASAEDVEVVAKGKAARGEEEGEEGEEQ